MLFVSTMKCSRETPATVTTSEKCVFLIVHSLLCNIEHNLYFIIFVNKIIRKRAALSCDKA